MHKTAGFNIGGPDENEKSFGFFEGQLGFFALSLIVFFVKLALLYYEFKTEYPTLPLDDLGLFELTFVIEVFAYIMLGTPAFFFELSGIRSVYRILKYKPQGATKIRWLISAILSFSVFVFHVLMFIGIFTGVLNYSKTEETILLVAGWPVVIASFVLGIKSKTHND